MSLKKLEQVKTDIGFRLWDLLIYGIILALVAVIFVVVFTTRNTDPLTGVRIFVNAEEIFSYEFGGADPAETEDIKVDGNVITVTVKTDGGGLNVVYIDKAARSVKMSEANCKGKQCLYFPEMKNNTDFIYCSPHGVKVEPLIKDYDSPDIIF